MKWWHDHPTIKGEKQSEQWCLDEAKKMLTRMIRDGVLDDNGITFKTTSQCRHWQSEIDLDGLAIVPDNGYRPKKRNKRIDIDSSIVKEIRSLLGLV